MNRKELAGQIYKASHIFGNFKLRSGQISNEYFDKYQLTSNPALLKEITNGMAKLIPEGTEILAGLEMGAIPLATALSLKTGIPATFVRKKAKEYGTAKFAEGADVKGKRALIIEDVVTTGGQIIMSANDLKNLGAKIEYVLCVIDRRDQKSKEILPKEGLELKSLFTMEELVASQNSKP
jgi:orotate phosphoribosyltransferase